MLTASTFGKARALLSVTAALCVVLYAGCVDLDNIITPRYTSVADSLTDTPDFRNGADDSVFASVGGRSYIFSSFKQRYDYFNDTINGAYYLAISIRRGVLAGPDNEYGAISLRLEGIRDTGTYQFNAPFAEPPKNGADPATPPVVAAQYQRENRVGFVETFSTGVGGTHGWIRIKEIDHARQTLRGTFEFTGYSQVSGDTVRVYEGGFLLFLRKSNG